MTRRLVAPLILACGVATGACAPAPVAPPASAEPPAAGSLFASDPPLQLSLEAPWSEIADDRGDTRKRHPGVLIYQGPRGPVRLDVELRTRGHYRLQRRTCSFPPLRLDFRRDQLRGTAFDPHRRLKLVTHCRAARSHDQYVLQEYLAYRAYNALTERSFRVRLAWIRYLDPDGAPPLERYGFFIEPDAEMARRNGRRLVKDHLVDPDQVDPDALAVFELFQYMIANTDWASFEGSPGEPCCHNAVLIRDGGRAIPVPYDFDFAGVVDAPYASPNPVLPIRSVRQRLYRGTCKPPQHLQRAIALHRERREAIYAPYRTLSALDPRSRERALGYYDAFFETIGEPRRVERELIGRCRTLPELPEGSG